MTHRIDYLDRLPVNVKYDLVKQVIPEYFRTAYPTLVTFLEKYYDYIEDDDGGRDSFSYVIQTIYQLREAESNTLSDLDELLYEIGYNVKIDDFDSTVDPRHLAKLIAYFHRTKGREISANGFFNAFFGEDATITYPKNDMFILNESKLGPEYLKYIRDDKRYQIFSILMTSGVSITKWRKLFQKFVHPSGFYIAGDVQLIGVASGSCTGPTVLIDSSAGEYLVLGTATPAEFATLSSITGIVPDSEDSDLSAERINLALVINPVASSIISGTDNQYNTIKEFLSANSQTLDKDSDGTIKSVGFSNTLETFDEFTVDFVSAADPYGILGNQFSPEFVADFSTYQYRANDLSVALSDALTFSRASLATMVDSDGVLKWAPHNLLKYSEDFTVSDWADVATTVTANAAAAPDGTTTADEISHTSTSAEISQTVSNILTNGEKYTVSVYVKYVDHQWFRIYHENGSTYFDLVNGVTGTVSADSASITDVGNGWYLCEVNNTHNTSDTSVLTVFLLADGNGSGTETSGTSAYIWGAHLYRSDDLGGMVNNPATGDSYVPTTSAAVYLPRTGHHVYNGSAWVNEGLLLESEARTNLMPSSNDGSAWSGFVRGAIASAQGTGPDGLNSFNKLTDDNSTGSNSVYLSQNVTVSTSTAYTFSVFAKADQLSLIALKAAGFTTPANGSVWFDLSSGTVGTENAGLTGTIQDFGGGIYRCSITFTTDAADTAGSVQLLLAQTDGVELVDLDSTSSVLWFGAQFEAGSTPSSYIFTTGSTATRAAETLTIPSAKLPWTTPNVISIQMQGRMTYADEGNSSEIVFWRWRLGGTDQMLSRIDTSGALVGRYITQQTANNVYDQATDAGTEAYAPGILQPLNIASRHGSTFINGAADGTSYVENTTPVALPDLSATDLDLGYDYMGTVKLVRMWDEDVTDAGIVAATT